MRSANADGPRADLERLAQLVTEMDELFLLVVAGEYNAGKSTFINALLGDEVFAMGDLPTTRVISILRYGEPGPPEPAGEHTRIYHYPLDVLRDLEIVDTPGTNSIERMEEEITRGFVPRADLVLFVTSLLQPLTASELDFLEPHPRVGQEGHLHRQRRRPAQLRRAARARSRVPRRARSARDSASPRRRCTSSARCEALRAQARGEGATARGGIATPPDDARDEFPALERYLLETLRETERVRLKLLSPLGVLRHVLERNLASIEARRTVVHEDGRVLARRARPARAPTRPRCAPTPSAICSSCARRSPRSSGAGRTWLERNIRIGNINLLRNKDAVENRFRNEVVADAPREIEDVVHRMVDWTVAAQPQAVDERCSPSSMRTRRGCARRARSPRTATRSSSTIARSCSRGSASRWSAGSATSMPRPRRAKSWSRCARR